MERKTLYAAAAGLALAALVAGCNRAAKEAPTAVTSSAATEASTGHATALASAEAFENLAEGALAVDPKVTEALLVKARQAAATARPLLAPSAGTALAEIERRIDAAVVGRKPVELSLAANDGFRAMLSASGGEGRIPLAIGLLDYTGFRIAADNRDNPPRWADMAATLADGRRMWTGVKSQVNSAKAQSDFDAALGALDQAITARDSGAAGRAAARELELVDVLENATSGP